VRLGAASRQCCFRCQGAAHPATGHAFTTDVLYCGPCTRTFFKWVREHTSKRPSKRQFKTAARFYEEAARCVKVK
jgi:hypothetical protein